MGSSCTRADAEGASTSIMPFADQEGCGPSWGRDARTVTPRYFYSALTMATPLAALLMVAAPLRVRLPSPSTAKMDR